MKIRSIWCVLSVLLLVGATGCGSPCRDFCAAVADKVEACGLGVSRGEEAIDQCGEEIEETYSDELCSDGTVEIEEMSCSEFEAIMAE